MKQIALGLFSSRKHATRGGHVLAPGTAHVGRNLMVGEYLLKSKDAILAGSPEGDPRIGVEGNEIDFLP